MGRRSDGPERAAKAAQVRKDRQQAKVVLKEFREHFDELDKDHDEVLDCNSTALSQHFARSQNNLTRARTVDQAYVDAQIFHRLGDFSRRQGAQLQTGLRSYGVKSFVDSLVTVMEKTQSQRHTQASSDGDDNPTPMSMSLAEIGASVKSLFKTVPVLDFMYGNAPVESDAPAQARRKAPRVKKGDIATKPAELVRGEIEQTETDKQVARMKRELNRAGEINFWEFVVDPDDGLGYTRTVENIFHSSFLIKDRYAHLDLSQDPPIFKYTDPAPDGGGKASEPEESSQIVLGFDMKSWKKVREEFGITEPFLPAMKRTPMKGDEELQRLRELEEMDESE